ncbi:MAG: methyltransferase domain-containing protein [Bacteroidetes bacterium]|nr:methyltransferase domain-containing protein [Bacteroidota bacterium]
MITEVSSAVNLRYSKLAESSCCLSCGGAINHSKVAAGETCVDLGSGRGTDVLRMAESVGLEGFVYGIDISEGMLKKAEKNAEKLGVKNVSFLKSNLENIPLEDAAVDLVISNCTINHADNKQTVWNEIFRILKKGGRFVVSDIYSSVPVPDEYNNDPAAVAECWAGSVTREMYAEQLNNAGFTDVHILEESDPYPKGKIEVASWTILGIKPSGCSCRG